MGVTDGEGFLDSPLWAFSVQHYAKRGVRDACLGLQDEDGLDVNIALACLWHERRGGAVLSSDALRGMLDRTDDVRQLVYAIRTSRRTAKTMRLADALHRALLRSELVAENLVQLRLFEHLEHEPCGAPTSGSASLQAYATTVGRSLPPSRVRAFAAV